VIQGFLLNVSGFATATLTGLDPHATYYYEVFQFDSPNYATANTITVNGINEVTTDPGTSDDPTTTGQVSADENGQIVFRFDQVRQAPNYHVHFAGINVQKICGKYLTISDIFLFLKFSVRCIYKTSFRILYTSRPINRYSKTVPIYKFVFKSPIGDFLENHHFFPKNYHCIENAKKWPKRLKGQKKEKLKKTKN